MQERVLALDISSKTGFAFILRDAKGFQLIESGTIPGISEPVGQYPDNYVEWAYRVFANIVDLVERLAPDILVIEETVAGSKSVFSQKILEFTHFLVSRMIRETGIRRRYFLTGEWRKIVGCVMTKEEKAQNKEVRDYKKKTKEKLARDKNNKVIGLRTKKHINVRRANEIYGDQLVKPLIKKQEDEADALLLAAAWHFEKTGNK